MLPAYPAELWETARRLVVEEGRTHAQAAAATGISRSAIEKRAAKRQWTNDRAKSVAYDANIRLLKSALLEAAKKAASNGTVDDAYKATQAWRQAEVAYPEHRYTPAEQDPDTHRRIALEILEALVKYATEHDRVLLATLQPHLRPFAVSLEASFGG